MDLQENILGFCTVTKVWSSSTIVFALREGITCEVSPSGMPQLNGLAAEAIVRLWKWQSAAKMPKSLWIQSLMYAVILLNAVPHKELD